MKLKQSLYFLTILISSIMLIISMDSCKKEDSFAEGNVNLSFSTDTILFDTLFTTIGSSTYTLIVTNNEDQKVNISQVYLGEGQASKYRMNVDGYSGYSISDIEIAAHDSLYIFVEVTIDPNSTTDPMLVTDSILFSTNGNLQDVKLIAYGRDAYFILPNKHIAGLPPFNIVAREGIDTTWASDKPIVIYGYAVVDSTATLRIEEGTEVYFHNKSGLWVYKGGNIIVNGTKDKPITFQGDRPEAYYEDLPGQWDRIWINEGSVDNEINYAIIRNGFIGIQAEIFQQHMGNSIIIKNTIIENMSGVGILSRNHHIDAENLLISNCKQYNLALTMGGDYEFRHCTFANYWNYDIRKTPSVYVNNYYKDGNDNIYNFNLTKANFLNCIIYGNAEEELVLDDIDNGTDFNYLFDHALLKTQNNTSDANFWLDIVLNSDPKFKSTSDNDFHIEVESAAIENGKAGVLPPKDLDEVVRDASTPTLGAYEFIP